MVWFVHKIRQDGKLMLTESYCPLCPFFRSFTLEMGQQIILDPIFEHSTHFRTLRMRTSKKVFPPPITRFIQPSSGHMSWLQSKAFLYFAVYCINVYYTLCFPQLWRCWVWVCSISLRVWSPLWLSQRWWTAHREPRRAFRYQASHSFTDRSSLCFLTHQDRLLNAVTRVHLRSTAWHISCAPPSVSANLKTTKPASYGFW